MKTDVAKVTYPVIRSRVLALLELLSTAIKKTTPSDRVKRGRNSQAALTSVAIHRTQHRHNVGYVHLRAINDES